ncbi:MAG: ATP-grasp domain-containing protein [Candidatus Omnitrophota bacterium]
MKKIIGLTYDLKQDWTPDAGDPPDANAEHDSSATVDSITQAFESAGHTVRKIGNIFNLLKTIDQLNVDIVFNIAEGRFGRNRESQVPVLLETKRIPFVGSDGLALGITLDKVMAKRVFIAEGIPTPKFFEARNCENLKKQNRIGFPLIVKPSCEGTSKGLTENAKVHDFKGLKRQVELVTTQYKQPALVEEFIRGSEYTVAVLGNEHPQAMPVVQINIDGKKDLGDVFFTSDRVSLRKDTVEYICPAQISKKLSSQMQELAVRAFKALGCYDFARIDFRVDKKGKPFMLEVNPLPSLSQEDAFFFIAQARGITYNDIVNEILGFGLSRHGLTNGKYKEAKR